MDTEIRAMFPAAMDVQRRRFFEALGRIAGAQQGQADRDHLVPYLQELGRTHRKFGVRDLGRTGCLHQRLRPHDRQDRPGAEGAWRAQPPHPLRPGPEGQPGPLAGEPD